MQRFLRCTCLLLLCIPAFARAGVQLVVDGVDDPLKNAVATGVDASQYASRDVSEAQAQRLCDQSLDQARAALEPYGYYDASVKGELQSQPGGQWRINLHVTPGQSVVVTAVDLQLDDAADKITPIRRARRTIEQLKGQPLDHGVYEADRDALGAALTAQGFLDAKLLVHRVDVTRGEHSAVIHLAWDTGPRYRFGEVHFEGSSFKPTLLQRYLPFKQGDWFSQDKLLQLQQALSAADYFSLVNVQPDLDAKRDGVVDVQVSLAPAKRTVYTGGPFIGTDTGFGLRAGMEQRWVNNSGDKWNNELVVAQRLKTLSTLYSMPLPGPDQRALNYGANFRDSDTDTSKSRTLELVASESQLWYGWMRTIGLHALDGTFVVGQRGNEPDSTPGLEHGRTELVYPELSLTRKSGDNPTFVREGWSVTLAARSTLGSLLSDARFSQLTADARWITSFGGNNRLVLRGSAGTTWTDDFTSLPPQLRFFAGGDQSVRGYGFQSIGPENSDDRVIGGKNLLVASSTVEHYFTRNWGIAAFVDAGNAFDDVDYRAKIGAGLGLRWLSPVGMVRLDLGTPINDSQRHGVELHIVIGPDL